MDLKASKEDELRRQDLVVQISRLEAEKLAAAKNKKGALTKRINALNKELDKLTGN